MNTLSSLLLISLLTATIAIGSSSVVDLQPIAIADPAERAAVSAAAERLVASGPAGDLPALEILVREFTPHAGGVISGNDAIAAIGSAAAYGFGDPVKQRAWNAIQGRGYAVDFLEQAIKGGSERAALWGIKTLMQQRENSGHPDPMDASDLREDAKHWEEENRSPEVQRLGAVHGIIRTDFLRRIAPSIKRLSESKDDALRKAVSEFFDVYSWVGLFNDRDEIVATLAAHRADEKSLEKIIGDLEHQWGEDPKISPEIWEILLHAKDRELINTVLCYRWLFCLPSFSEDKRNFIEHQLATGDGRIWSNLNSVLQQLSMSVNPLAPEIIKSLGESTIPSVRKDAAGYLETLGH